MTKTSLRSQTNKVISQILEWTLLRVGLFRVSGTPQKSTTITESTRMFILTFVVVFKYGLRTFESRLNTILSELILLNLESRMDIEIKLSGIFELKGQLK